MPDFVLPPMFTILNLKCGLLMCFTYRTRTVSMRVTDQGSYECYPLYGAVMTKLGAQATGLDSRYGLVSANDILNAIPNFKIDIILTFTNSAGCKAYGIS